jgi:phage N-6-adenine-methyltransferase
VSVVGYQARNHPQQVAARGARPEVDDRAITAQDFAPLHDRFGFTVDAAASHENARLPRYWTAEDDALRQPWARERAWINPPYSHPNLPAWVAKAWQEWKAGGPALIVMLVPANRTEQQWWQELIEPYRDLPASDLHVEFLPGRMRFLALGQAEVGPDERPPFGCCLLIWEARAVTASPRLVPGTVTQVRVPRPANQGSLFGDVLEVAG